jgi:hypothetical protein
MDSLSIPDLAAVLRRVEVLELQNRRLRIAGAAVAALLGITFLAASNGPDKKPTEAPNRLALKDASGTERVSVSLETEGTAIRFLSQTGQEQANVEVRKTGMVLRWLGDNGQLQTGMSLEQAGVAIIAHDASGNVVTGANAIKNNIGQLSPLRQR